MFKRDWGNGLATGLIIGSGLVVLVLVIWYGPSCSQNYPCDYPHQNEHQNGSIWYDTAAQWIGAITGVAVSAFTFWTVLLVRKALAADNSALNESRLQTKAAMDALQISRFDQRPWIDFEIETFRNFQFPSFNEEHKAICFFPRIKIRNRGKSPAVSVRYELAAYFGSRYDAGDAVTNILSRTYPDIFSLGAVIFPGVDIIEERYAMVNPILRSDDPAEGNGGSPSIWLSIGLIYTDSFGTQFSTFRFFFAGLADLLNRPSDADTLLVHAYWLKKYI